MLSAFLRVDRLENASDCVRIYTLANFFGTSPPPDYTFAPIYGIKISLDYPVIKRAEFGEAVKHRKVQFEAKRYKSKYLFALNRLPSLGYYYIQQINAKRLRKNWEDKVSLKSK